MPSKSKRAILRVEGSGQGISLQAIHLAVAKRSKAKDWSAFAYGDFSATPFEERMAVEGIDGARVLPHVTKEVQVRTALVSAMTREVSAQAERAVAAARASGDASQAAARRANHEVLSAGFGLDAHSDEADEEQPGASASSAQQV